MFTAAKVIDHFVSLSFFITYVAGQRNMFADMLPVSSQIFCARHSAITNRTGRLDFAFTLHLMGSEQFVLKSFSADVTIEHHFV
jgi:hypothetical protein